MPELPDIALYLHALGLRIVGRHGQRARLASPFLFRSIDPPLDAVVGNAIAGVRRLGTRLVVEAEGGLFLIFHLLIAAGRADGYWWTGRCRVCSGRIGRGRPTSSSGGGEDEVPFLAAGPPYEQM